MASKRKGTGARGGRALPKPTDLFHADLRDLFLAYMRLDAVLSRRPLKSVIGPTEHNEYYGLIREIAHRAWREVDRDLLVAEVRPTE